MKTVTVNLKDLLKDNKTICMSPLRALSECYKCSTFLNALHRIIGKAINKASANADNIDLNAIDPNAILNVTISSLKCNPKIGDRNKLLNYIELKVKQIKLNLNMEKIERDMFDKNPK